MPNGSITLCVCQKVEQKVGLQQQQQKKKNQNEVIKIRDALWNTWEENKKLGNYNVFAKLLDNYIFFFFQTSVKKVFFVSTIKTQATSTLSQSFFLNRKHVRRILRINSIKKKSYVLRPQVASTCEHLCACMVSPSVGQIWQFNRWN